MKRTGLRPTMACAVGLLWLTLTAGPALAGTPTEARAAPVAASAEGDLPPAEGVNGEAPSEAAEADKAPVSGAIDIHERVTRQGSQSNLVAWSNLFVGALGTVVGDSSSFYGGAYFQPLALLPRAGEWVVGVNAVTEAAGTAHEIQTEYRCPYGFGLGGGYLEPADDRLTRFAKLSFDHTFGPIRILAAGVVHDVDDTIWPGGYGAIVWEHLMGAGGYDGEQWRAAVAFIAPEWSKRFQPAVEGFFVDSTIGNSKGGRFLFVNGTLGLKHPFLGHPATLGRAMGPQGLQFSNPLGYLSAVWNRAPEVWELGRVLSFRVLWDQAADETVNARYEGAFHPFNLDEVDNFGDGLFVGAFYRERPKDPTPGLVVGLSAKIDPLTLSAALDVETSPAAIGGTFVGGIPF